MKKTLKFLKEHKQFTFFGILAILIVLAAIFAPVLTGGVDPLKGSLTEALEAPSKAHIFGTVSARGSALAAGSICSGAI